MFVRVAYRDFPFRRCRRRKRRKNAGSHCQISQVFHQKDYGLYKLVCLAVEFEEFVEHTYNKTRDYNLILYSNAQKG